MKNFSVLKMETSPCPCNLGGHGGFCKHICNLWVRLEIFSKTADNILFIVMSAQSFMNSLICAVLSIAKKTQYYKENVNDNILFSGNAQDNMDNMTSHTSNMIFIFMWPIFNVLLVLFATIC